MSRILVVGGAGYIGSHMMKVLARVGHEPVYGTPEYTPIDEDHPRRPINPYGHSKHIIETILEGYRDAHGLSSTSLRYFNAAGADPDGELGERHEPESHLIPLVIQAVLGLRPEIKIYGTDYETSDGTCVRDYVHVTDLCDAHLLAMDRLMGGDKGRAYNLGNGEGFSVREVIETVREVSGRSFTVTETGSRPGDAGILVADASRAKTELSWSPRRDRLSQIITDVWNFYSNRPTRLP